MSEHTKGPLEVRSLEGVWSVFEAKTLTLTASCPDGAASRPSGIREVSADEALANARLYSASPDMYDECEDALGTINALLEDIENDLAVEGGKFYAAGANVLKVTQARLTAVLKKAEGREP